MDKCDDVGTCIEKLKKILTEMMEEFNDNRLPYLMERCDTIGDYTVGSVRANYIDEKIYNDYKEFIFKLSSHIIHNMVLEKCDRFYCSVSELINFEDNSEYICKKKIKYSFMRFNVFDIYDGEYMYPYGESMPVDTIKKLFHIIESIMTEIKLNLVEGKDDTND